jgi:7,8-dihydropterin-6-yl-methyl-4-(beta-D-ribofuranosyl)aminobenzene 5'-phosphate synthase
MAQNLKITVVVDNTAGELLQQEHGLSLWLETASSRVLFDTGQGLALPNNARELGIELESVDALVLSHGHYDHSGGIGYVLGRAQHAQVYCHPNVVVPRYSIREGVAKLISMPPEAVNAIERNRTKRVHWTATPKLISNGTGLTGAIPRSTGYEDTGGSFYLDPQGQKADWIEDDQALWMNTAEGLVICLGCAHAGVINTLRYVSAITGVSRIRALIGGLHLLTANDRRMEQTITALRTLAPDLIIAAHCTGERAIETLRGALGRTVVSSHSGATYEF